jgi:hypothetical protein
MKDKKMVTKKTWQEFRETGLLLFINQMLHLFGWAVVFEYESFDNKTDKGIIKEIYPARVKFRGFHEEAVGESYKNITKYLDKNIKALVKEAND